MKASPRRVGRVGVVRATVLHRAGEGERREAQTGSYIPLILAVAGNRTRGGQVSRIIALRHQSHQYMVRMHYMFRVYTGTITLHNKINITTASERKEYFAPLNIALMVSWVTERLDSTTEILGSQR